MMTRIRVTFGVVILLLSGVSAFAETANSGVAERLTALEATVRSLEQQIATLNVLLRTAIPSPVEQVSPFRLALANGQSKGSEQAKVVIAEFGDFECPFCGQFVHTTYQELIRKYIASGQVRYEFFNLPLEQVHPHAFKAAEAGLCAAAQGKFWQMHDRLFDHQQELQVSDLVSHAKLVGLDTAQFQTCIDSGVMDARIKADIVQAHNVGLTGTPSFLIGTMSDDGTAEITAKITGAQPFSVFQLALGDLLQGLTRR